MPHGGRVTIRTAHTRFTGAETTAPLPAPGAYALLEVVDTGTGMTADVKAHLFEPFFTTKEVGKGTGLGLATVYGVVKQSGGYIWVESETDRGTAVRIAFPVVAASPQPREVLPPRVESSPAGETVLLVEDEEAVRRAGPAPGGAPRRGVRPPAAGPGAHPRTYRSRRPARRSPRRHRCPDRERRAGHAVLDSAAGPRGPAAASRGGAQPAHHLQRGRGRPRDRAPRRLVRHRRLPASTGRRA